MKELRDIKLDLIMGNQNPIMDIFNEITDGIKIMNCNVYNEDGLEFIYYNKNNEWIFYQDIKNKRFWGEYNRYWSIFQTKFNLKYEEIQLITKLLVEEALKRELDTPSIPFGSARRMVEEALKRELDTPNVKDFETTLKVEEALKREVNTPDQRHHKKLYQVEEALKRELDTPLVGFQNLMERVEEVLKQGLDKNLKPITSKSYKVEEVLKRELDTKPITSRSHIRVTFLF